MSPKTVDAQRDVVKNERRQSYENAPYGMASIEIAQMLYPQGHPYRWPTIGYMEDLVRRQLPGRRRLLQDLLPAGERQPGRRGRHRPGEDARPRSRNGSPTSSRARRRSGRSTTRAPNLTEVKKKTIQDRVQLPRLYLTWITPAHFAPGDAELDVLSLLLAGGKNSRLYKRLVYDLQIAQDVAAFQASKTLNSEYQIVVTARPDASIDQIRAVVDEEIAQDPAGAARPSASSPARSTRSSRRSTIGWSASGTSAASATR